MMRLLTALAAVVGFAGLVLAADPALKAGVFDPPRQAPDFVLRGSNGADLKLSAYRGKVVMLAFGYTACTNVCPATLSVLAFARQKLGPQANDVQVVYITVDPERDTAAQMHDFLKRFDASFVGGTGTAEQLAAVRKDYGVESRRIIVDKDYAFAHSSFVYLIDRAGKIRALMPFGHSAEDFAHDAKILLQG
jgi:protein SCO1